MSFSPTRLPALVARRWLQRSRGWI